MRHLLIFFASASLLACSSSIVTDGSGGGATTTTANSTGTGPGCSGLPFACEVCNSGWTCEPNPSCLTDCPSVACAECPADGQSFYIPGCFCFCDGTSQFTCSPTTETCCTTNIDCGDESFVPCVAGVCKQPVLDACWVDEECPAGQKCVGATVCACGLNCIQADTPGHCMP